MNGFIYVHIYMGLAVYPEDDLCFSSPNEMKAHLIKDSISGDFHMRL